MFSPTIYAQLRSKIEAQRTAAAALPKPAINIVSTPPIAGAPQVVTQTQSIVQRAAAILKGQGTLTQAAPAVHAPDILSGHSGDSLAVNSNGGFSGVAPLALTSGVQSDLTGDATDTGTQAENAKSFIQIIAVAALLWFGWGYIEKRH